MKYKLSLKNKTTYISAWKIKDEKNAILSIESEEPKEVIDSLFEMLILEHKELEELYEFNLSYYDKLYILLMTRTRSVGNTMDIEYTCPHCKKYTQSVVSIQESIEYNPKDKKVNDYVIINDIDFYESVILNNKKLNIEDLDKLSLDEYSLLEKEYNKLQGFIVNFDSICPICNKNTIIKPSVYELVKDYILSVDLKTLYQMQVKLKLKANFSIQEIEHMYPFEQDLYLNLVIKQIKED